MATIVLENVKGDMLKSVGHLYLFQNRLVLGD